MISLFCDYYFWVDRLGRGLIIPITIRVIIDKFGESQILYFHIRQCYEEIIDIFSIFSAGKKRVSSEFLLFRGACHLGDCYLSGFYPFEG